MTGIEYLRDARERYVERYRSVLRAKRAEGIECAPEVWLDPKVPPGEPKPPHPLCVDILIQAADGPSLALAGLPDVDRVERVNDEAVAAFVAAAQHPHRIFLGNLHRLLARTAPEGRPREVNRFLRGQRESMGPSAAPDLSQLRLLVKDDRFLDNIRRQVPDMKPLVREHLAADLWLVCVWDAPNGMRFATEGEAELYELSAGQMLQRARENYLRERPPVDLADDGPLRVAQTHDCYDATLLIDDKWWDDLAGKLRGHPLACVPARNLVLIGGSNDPKAVPALRALAKRIEAAGDHLISSTILVRRDGVWNVHEEPAPIAPPPNAPPPGPAPKPWWRFW